MPFETLALPLLWWVNKLPYYDGFAVGWLDTYEVQFIPFIANAFSIYLFYQYFDSIPKELDEAAKVDGAGWFTIYRKIIMPLSGPAIATVAILTFLPAWNQYLWPLMAVQTEELRPVMVGIDYFKQLNTSWGQIMAYASLITIPVLVAVHRLPALLHQQHRLQRRERLTRVHASRLLAVGLLARRGRPTALPPVLPARVRARCTTPIAGTCGPRSGTRCRPTWCTGSRSPTRWCTATRRRSTRPPPGPDRSPRDPDGTWFMFYTGRHADRRRRERPADRASHVRRPVPLGQGTGGIRCCEADPAGTKPLGGDGPWRDEHWRDPWVFADPDGDGWHMLITARANHRRVDDRGVVGHARSTDLETLGAAAAAVPAGAGFGQLEVFQPFVVDGRQVLIFNCMVGRHAGGGSSRWCHRRGLDRRREVAAGPYDIAGAQVVDDPSLYVGKFVTERETGDTKLLAFVHDRDGAFVGEITDPYAVTWDGDRLRLT